MTPDRLAEAEARLAAITPWPWENRDRNVFGADGSCVAPLKHHSDYGYDAEFIAHAPDDLRLALAALKRVREVLAFHDGDEDDADFIARMDRGEVCRRWHECSIISDLHAAIDGKAKES